MSITERINVLRAEMKRESIDAVIIPTTDPHDSEYPAPYWKGREWISGFNGSAGTVVVTNDDAALWTDSRYFIQAAEQLQGTGITLMKEKIPDTPSITEWIKMKLSANGGTCTSIDGSLMAYASLREMEKELRKCGITLRTNFDALSRIWKDRPALPHGEVYAIRKDLIGETTGEKLCRIREAMRKERCTAHVVTDLMSIAWVTNLRGNDVAMTPVFVANMYIAENEAVLFTDGMLTSEATDMIREYGIFVRPYREFADFLRKTKDERIMCDGETSCYTVFNIIKDKAVDMESPIPQMKSVKNAKEIEGYRASMRRDGVAMVKFLRWLKPAVEAGGQTEISVSDKLRDLRAEAPEFRDLSFDTICGYNEHGAIVHYEATPDTDVPLKPEGLLLLDSGAQYIDGTTDITRTMALGPITEDMKKVYTLVLKANINLAMAKFPEGTTGTQLDVLARGVLWQHGLHYWHGTGHGVGWCLAVHEGPHQFRMEWRPAPLRENMTITDEPGVYLDGRFGVRTENTMLIVKDSDTEFGKFLRMESLTLCPIDTTPVIIDMLTPQERQWLNDYHATVCRELLPLLADEADKQWLKDATKEI